MKVYTIEPLCVNIAGPVRTPCTSSAPRTMASGGVPGMPRTNVGIKPPPTVALLADSVAMMPSGSPSPNLWWGLAVRLASEYATRPATDPPAPGKMPTTVPMTEDRIRLNFEPIASRNASPMRTDFTFPSTFKCRSGTATRSIRTGIQ